MGHSVVAIHGHLQPLQAAFWRRVVGSALAAGAVRWRIRASLLSFSGAVVVAGFTSATTARHFAAAWAGWCGVACFVRRRACARWGVVWAVSVPVVWGNSSCQP